MRNLTGKRGHFLDKILVTIGFCGLIVCFLWGILGVYNKMVTYQYNVIGTLYSDNPEVAKDYLYALFEPTSEKNVKTGVEALSEFGVNTNGKGDVGSTLGIGRTLWLPIVFAAAMAGLAGCGIYARWKAEKLEKQALLEKLQELEKNQSEEDFLTKQNQKIQNFIENVAHQIKTPISRVYSSLYFVEKTLERCEQKKRLEECYSHLESVSSLMKRLTDIGRLEAGKVIFQKEEFDLRLLIEEVVRNSCIGEERIALKDFTEEKLMYYGDYEWLGEALKNIIKNGLEHDTSGLLMEVSCIKTQEQIKITIRDHGKGVSPKDIPNLFDRFYIPEEVKSNHTGIGLNLAKLVIEGHFGSIYVYNHAEGGAVFNIILPLYSLKMGKQVT